MSADRAEYEFRVEIRVIPRRGLLDPQGKAVADALHALGFADVADVRVGRHVELDVRAADADAARRRAGEMCERLLANPVTEDYVVEDVAATVAPRG
jgi:phosphoribosylformylglycinamidine synthase